MKKFFCLLTTLTLIVSCIGCNSKTTNNDSKKNAESKHEHTYEETVIEATCEQNGTTIFTCSSCGDTYTEVITTLGHSYEVTETVEATCKSKGKNVYTCKNCNDSYTEKTDKAKHTWKAATCTSARKCKVCGTTKGSELGHNVNSNGKCVKCGKQVVTSTPTPSSPSSSGNNYSFSTPGVSSSFYYYRGSLTNTIKISNVTAKVKDKSKNPAIVTISFKETKTYQDNIVEIREHHVVVYLKDFNGNVIGQKDVESMLADGESDTFTVQFEVTPGNYTIEIESA